MFERATTIDEALVEIGRWASSLPGDFPVDAADRDDGITEVTVNGVLLSSGIRLSGTLQLVEGDGRPEHQHVRIGRIEKRISAGPQTLESLRAKLVGTNLQHAGRK